MEEKEVLVKVEGLSKKFCKDLKTSLKYGVQDLFSNFMGNKDERHLRKKEFWALKNVNFELHRGECLGLIGHNGAGKSTLLKILNGLIKPDAGRVIIKGKVGALIELGAGFNPILTGRENIYNNGAILGFTRKEIQDKIEEIIDFAEIREFIDMPVQNYSSGMKIRLGFSIAAQMEPDVLIIDEVLAVGDVNFRAKCYERISELLQNCCVIFVTHSMSQVSKICSWSILLHRGHIQTQGSNGEVIESYYNDGYKKDKTTLVHADRCYLESFNISENVFNGEIKNLIIEINIRSEISIEEIDVGIFLMSRELIPVCQINSKMKNQKISLNIGSNRTTFVIDELHLNTGIYNFALTIESLNPSKVYLWMQNLKKIQVFNKYTLVSPVLIKGKFEC